jgi:RNA polymerase sigma-70 factor (ECF subfamily)
MTSRPHEAEETTPAAVGEWALVERLRRGDEAAFVELLDAYHPSLVRMAMLYVPNRAVAEDVAQEVWLGVVRGIDRFEGRSTLRTWIFRILMNVARTRGRRESRSIPFSALAGPDLESGEPSVDPARFRPATAPRSPGHWASPPSDWGESPEDRLLAGETRALIQQAIETLPPSQREVITMRDIEGWASDEVCNTLAISETNQRVLLHRARTKVRRALEDYLGRA